MDRLLRLFMLWLLIAALPVQGVAAVGKLSCAPAHHDAAALVMPVAVDHHHGQQASAHHHHSALPAQAHVPLTLHGDTAPTTPDSTLPDPGGSCSACAACCLGALAPPAALNWPAAFADSGASTVTAFAHFTGFIPAGLERPPKAFSA